MLGGAESVVKFDNVLVRPFVTTEPTVSAGAEQNIYARLRATYQ